MIKGPQVMKGYGNSPEQNSNAFLDGWLRTGDLVYYDERGCIFIKDRLKEVIKVKALVLNTLSNVDVQTFKKLLECKF